MSTCKIIYEKHVVISTCVVVVVIVVVVYGYVVVVVHSKLNETQPIITFRFKDDTVVYNLVI